MTTHESYEGMAKAGQREMTWRVWTTIWLASLTFTAVVVGLAFWINFWALPVVFGVLFFGLGAAVTRA